MLSNFKEIISRLEQQKIAIDRAIGVLREFDGGDATQSTPTAKVATKKSPIKKRTVSEEGRKRMAEAQRKRWAAKKKASKKLAIVA